MRSVLETNKIHRLLIRGTNWIGDSVMAIPALKMVRQALPQSSITLLVLPWVSDIYQGSQFVDEILLYDRDGRHAGMLGRLRLIRTLAERQFDAALLLQNAFEPALLARLAGIPLRAGYNRDGRGWLLTHAIPLDRGLSGRHQIHYYLDLVEQFLGWKRAGLSNLMGLPRLDEQVDLRLSIGEKGQKAARQRLQEEGVSFRRKLVGITPGASYGSAKRWLSDRYAEVLDRLIEEEHAEVIIFGSKDELTIAESIRQRMANCPKILSGKTRLSQLMAMLTCCDLLITNDSGPMHLAAALRIPTLALFGSTDQSATGPLNPSAVVLNKKVECSPCLLRECPIDHRCMTHITADEVYQQAVRMLRVNG